MKKPIPSILISAGLFFIALDMEPRQAIGMFILAIGLAYFGYVVLVEAQA